LNAHDGAESLHRELWAADIPHEYHLRKNADHVGADQGPRLLRALQWINGELQPPAAPKLTGIEHAWQAWLHDPSQAQPAAPLPAESSLFPAYLRALIEPQRKEAAKQDPTMHRHFGLL
jgi:S-formylglutathione hydrolase